MKDLVEFSKWNKESVLLYESRNNYVRMTQSYEWSKLYMSPHSPVFWIVLEIMAVKFMPYFEGEIIKIN